MTANQPTTQPTIHYALSFQLGSWKIITTINMAIIFFIFGITLETAELKDAFKGYKSLIQGLVVILVVTSFTGFIPMAVRWLPSHSRAAWSARLPLHLCLIPSA